MWLSLDYVSSTKISSAKGDLGFILKIFLYIYMIYIYVFITYIAVGHLNRRLWQKI